MEHLEFYGPRWVEDTWKLIQEDKADYYRFLTSLFPLARTPMDKNGASSLQNYEKDLIKMIENMTPWRKSTAGNKLAHLRKIVKSGEIAVMLEPGETPNSPLYEDLRVIRPDKKG